MEKLAKLTFLLDADVLINWLAQEVEPDTNKPLWEAPFKIISLIEKDEVNGALLLTTLLEIRYVLRRKKDFSEQSLEKIIEEILGLLEIYVPDEISLIKANQLQAKFFLDPFDAILLASALSIKPEYLILRDKNLLKIASNFIIAKTPEQFLAHKPRTL